MKHLLSSIEEVYLKEIDREREEEERTEHVRLRKRRKRGASEII